MRCRTNICCLIVILVGFAHHVFASPILFEWSFNDDGVIYDGFGEPELFDLPVNFDASLFDWDTGLGAFSITCMAGGSHFFIAFFDHEIVEGINTYYYENAAFFGEPGAGQTWEIDEPGWASIGDIYNHFENDELDGAIAEDMEDDVSMAIGWNFFLEGDETATIAFRLSTTPLSGFCLSQFDPDGGDPVYFSSSLDIRSGVSPVPEPASALIFGVGIFALAVIRQCRNYFAETPVESGRIASRKPAKIAENA